MEIYKNANHGKLSKFLSYILRHKPEKIGITLSEGGWADIKELIKKSKCEINFDFNDILRIVKKCDKQRFTLSKDLCSIRCAQGHSFEVNLNFKEVVPPNILYHGTPDRNVEQIRKKGLNKMKRNYVHLSVDTLTAINVGKRKGNCTVLQIDALKMHNKGYKFFISDNNVYLTDHVPSKFIL